MKETVWVNIIIPILLLSISSKLKYFNQLHIIKFWMQPLLPWRLNRA